MRVFAGIVLLFLSNCGLGGGVILFPIMIVFGFLTGDQEMIGDINKGLTYLVGLTIVGALSLYGAIKVWANWRMGLGILWAVLGVGLVSEGLSAIEQTPVGIGVIPWGVVSLLVGAAVLLVDRRRRS